MRWFPYSVEALGVRNLLCVTTSTRYYHLPVSTGCPAKYFSRLDSWSKISKWLWFWLRAKWFGSWSASVIAHFAWAKYLFYAKSLFDLKSLIPSLKELWEIRRVHLTKASWPLLPFSRYNPPAKLPWYELLGPIRYLRRIPESRRVHMYLTWSAKFDLPRARFTRSTLPWTTLFVPL